MPRSGSRSSSFRIQLPKVGVLGATTGFRLEYSPGVVDIDLVDSCHLRAVVAVPEGSCGLLEGLPLILLHRDLCCQCAGRVVVAE